MFLLLFSASLVLCSIIVIIMMSALLNNKSIVDKEKASPFECGFDPNTTSRLPFCMKFFLVAVIFLVFDIEVALLIPYAYSFTSIQIFLLILILGLFYEWLFGGLEWMS